MWGFIPTISDDHLLIVGYYTADMYGYRGAYKIPVVTITDSIDQQCKGDTHTKWIKLTATDHWEISLVPSSSPLMIVGGQDINGTAIADIKIYNDSNNSWENTQLLLESPRSYAAVVALENDDFIVIGGCTKGNTADNAVLTSLKVVELGEAKLLH